MELTSLNINPIYWILAYSGMFIHILLKVAELNKVKGFSIKSYINKNIYTIIASFVMIPIILIVLTDSSLKDLFPINKATSVLAGYQTQSLFKSLMGMYENRAKKLEDNQ